MDDAPEQPAALVPPKDDALRRDRVLIGRETSSDLIPLIEETLEVGKRRVVIGGVRVGTRTETRHESVDVELARSTVEVTRVPVERPVDAVPAVRTEGDTTIMPVVEERLVVVTQLFLKEELHIRHIVEREVSRQSVELRRQRAVIERIDPEGHVVVDAVQSLHADDGSASDRSLRARAVQDTPSDGHAPVSDDKLR